MTSYHLPGQTLYHGGLLVEGSGLRMFFAGDSFTPAGIDDYCALNRNWLGRGAGFRACLDLMQRIKPTDVFNCHVDVAFDFTADQYRAMQENLDEREESFGRLFPWDHANYGMDESWVRAFPYEQSAGPGEQVRVQVFVTNHSAGAKEAAARIAVPRSWRRGGEQATPWRKANCRPNGKRPLRCGSRFPATPRRAAIRWPSMSATAIAACPRSARRLSSCGRGSLGNQAPLGEGSQAGAWEPEKQLKTEN
jgi:hypothetical protein